MSSPIVRLCILCGEHPGVYPVFLRLLNPNARAVGSSYDLTGNWCEICVMSLVDYCKAHIPQSVNRVSKTTVKPRKTRAPSKTALAPPKPYRTEIRCPACGSKLSLLAGATEAFCFECGNVCRGQALERALDPTG